MFYRGFVFAEGGTKQNCLTNLQPRILPNLSKFYYPTVCAQHALKHLTLLFIS